MKVQEVGKKRKEITIEAYFYVFIVKKLKDHIQNSKYYETDNLKTGAHKYTHLRQFLPYYIEKYVNVKSTSIN